MGARNNPYTITVGQGPKRYAPYVEAYHDKFLEAAYIKIVSLDDNPPTPYEMGDKLLDAFFGMGYFISSYPAIYDMCGKYVAGLDIDAIWVKMFEDIHGQSAIPDASDATVSEEHDTWKGNLTTLAVESRDNNTISSSSYMLSKAIIERRYAVNASIYRTNLQFMLLENTAHETYINAQRKMITVYAIMMQYFYDSQARANKRDFDQQAKEKLWPLTTRNEFSRYLASMSGVKAGELAEIEKRKRSWLSKILYILSNAVNYALIGYQIGGIYGAAIGAQIGIVIGEAQILREEGSPYWYVPFIMGLESVWIVDLL